VKRPVIIFGCVAVAIGLWLTAVLNADRENIRLDFVSVYAQLGADGEPESCPDLTQPPSAEAIEGARQLAQIARQDPTRALPNPNPSFGATLPAANALTVTAGSLRLCVQNAEGEPHPGWNRVLLSLR
jgi:hypothetical protein